MGNQDTQEQVDVQFRLMQMLDSVHLDQSAIKQDVPVKANGTHCDNCGITASWEGASWCPNCGFYPKLGRTVFDTNTPFAEEDEEQDVPLTLQDLIKSVPGWAFLLLGGCLILFVTSLITRMMVPDLYYRGIIALYQLAIGCAVFGLAHLRAYFIASQDTDKIAFASMFTAPVQIWSEAFKKMPKVRKVFYAGGWGFSAIVLAVLVVGLNWDGLFNPQQYANRPKFNPLKYMIKSVMSLANAGEDPAKKPESEGLGMILDLAGSGEGGGNKEATGQSDAKDIEGAIGQFADVNGVEGAQGDASASGSDTERLRAGIGDELKTPRDVAVGNIKMPNASDVSTDPSTASTNALQTSTEKPVGQATPHSKDTTASTASPSNSLESSSIKRQFPKAVKTIPKVDPARPNQAEYVIFGYTTNASGDVRSVLLAEMKQSRPVRFKTRFPLSATDAATIERLEATLHGLRTRRPAVRSPYSALWVKPVVMCQIAYDGLSAGGSFSNGLVTNYYMLPGASTSFQSNPSR